MTILNEMTQLRSDWEDDITDYIFDENRCKKGELVALDISSKIQNDPELKEQTISLMYFMYYAKEQGFDKVSEKAMEEGAFSVLVSLGLKEMVDKGNMFAFKRDGTWFFTITGKGKETVKGILKKKECFCGDPKHNPDCRYYTEGKK